MLEFRLRPAPVEVAGRLGSRWYAIEEQDQDEVNRRRLKPELQLPIREAELGNEEILPRSCPIDYLLRWPEPERDFGALAFDDFADLRPGLLPCGGRPFFDLSAASQYSMYFFAGTRLIASPITSSAMSSSFLKRTHALPMSSFLPVLAQACRNHCEFSVEP